jgi:NitT/TauT family transport system substrate-binding protein
MNRRLTPFAKFLLVLLSAGAIVFAFLKINEKTKWFDNLNTESSGAAGSESKDALKVQVFTWGGYAPGMYFNEGFTSSSNSRYKKEYDLAVDFMLIDDFDASRQAWKAGEVDLLGTTADALPTEMEGLKDYEPQIVFQVDWSRGGDAIVARRGIQSINDLKDKQVAVTPSTPSMTFLIFMLEAANMSLKDIKMVEVPTAIDAATAFKSGKVDAAVVWSPDDEICTREVPGSKILQSTREASHIIADVFIAKKSFVEANKDKINKFYEGWMKAVSEINSQPANKKKAADIMAAGTGISPEDAMGAISNVYLCNHGDNVNFFGRNTSYKGVTGESLYTKMGEVYAGLGYAPANRPAWRLITYPGGISAAQLTGPEHEGEAQRVFTPVNEEVKTAPAVASKPISISFQTGQFALDENAKTIIDLQFSETAKAFANTRIRIEGNTDNVGSRKSNVTLSEKRAESVAKYLIEQYNMDRNRLIVIGNGPDKPVAGCESNQTEDCKAKNRRTEFQLIAD